MRHSTVKIPKGPLVSVADMLADNRATHDHEPLCERLRLPASAARIFGALAVTWNPLARILLEQRLDELLDAAGHEPSPRRRHDDR